MARSRRASAPRPAARPAPRAAPAPSRAPPPMQTSQPQAAPAMQQPSGGGGMMGGMMGMIGQGLAFGTGSAVAHRAVDAVMGPKTVQHEHINAPPPESPGAPSQVAPGQDACQWQAKAFQDCVMQNTTDIAKCQFYVDMLNECKKTSETATTL